MATNFDLLRRSGLFSTLGSGGLLGLDRPLTPEEEEELRLQQELNPSLYPVVEGQPDPLAPLPEPSRPMVIDVEEQPDPLAPVPEAEKPLVKDEKEEEKPPLVQEVQERSVEEVIAPLAKPPLVMPAEDQMTKVDNWVFAARNKARVEIEALAKNSSTIEVSALRAAHASELERAINSPEMWKATPKEFAELDARLANEVFGGVDVAAPMAQWEELAKWRSKPGNTTPSVVSPQGVKTGRDAEADPTATDSFMKGAATTSQMVSAGVEAIAEVVGAEGLAKAAGNERRKLGAIASVLPEGVTLSEIEGVASALQWAKQTAIEQGVLMAVPMSGAVAGRVMAGSLGAKLGAFTPSYLLSTGEIQVGNKADSEANRATILTLTGGAAVAALDSVLPNMIGTKLVSTFGRKNGQELAQRMLLLPATDDMVAMAGRIAKGGATSAAVEFGTEANQTLIAEVTTALETGKPISPGLMYRMFEAGVTGAFMGGTIGAVTSGAQEAAQRNAPIRELRDAEWASTPQQAASAVIQQREAAARGEVVGEPVGLAQLRQSKMPAVPVVISGDDKEKQARTRLVAPTPAPVNKTGTEEKFAIPKGRVTSTFGPRQTFRTSNGQQASSNHAGLDIAMPAGSKIPAGASGVVVSAGTRGGYGNQVVVQHSDGTTSSYSHLSKINVEVGQEIGQGQSVGVVGKTGNATGIHLHLERRDRQGRAINPSNGSIVATERDEETQEWVDDTDWDESQTEIDNFYDDMLAQEEADEVYAEATGQQWDPVDFEPVTPAAEPAPGPTIARGQTEEVEPTIARGQTEEVEPTIARGEPVAEEPVERLSRGLDEAKARNPARAAIEAEALATEEAADYTQPLASEEPVFATDESGQATQEVMGYVNPETGAVRAIGDPPAQPAEAPTTAPAVPVPDLPPQSGLAPDTDTVQAERRDYAAREQEALDRVLYGNLTRADREALADSLPQPGERAKPETVEGRGTGQAVALGLMEAPALEGRSKAFTTAYNIGLKEGQAALNTAKAGATEQEIPAVATAPGQDFVAEVDGATYATTPEIQEGSTGTPATPPAEISAPALVIDEGVDATVSEFTQAVIQPDKKLSKQRIAEINKIADKAEDKLWGLEVDGEKAPIKRYMQRLEKDGILPPGTTASMAYMFSDRDMGAEDVASEVRSYIQMWQEEQLAAPADKAKVTKQKRTAKTPKATKLEDVVPGYAAVAKWLTSEERERARRSAAKKMATLWDTLPDPQEIAAVAISGRDARGWYENSAQAIAQVFGQTDGIRFAALLAATSPQNSVHLNLYNTLKIWTAWNRAGRPTDRRDIVKIMGENVAGDRGLGSVLTAWINNSVTALATADVQDLVLSGPKVNSFFANLVADVNEVTLDTWMAVYSGVDAEKTLKGTNGKKSVGYMTYAARVRKAAEVATRRTGETWTPAEIQETVWAWAKTVYEMRDASGENRTVRQMLNAGAVTRQDVAGVDDFSTLFSEGVFANILEEGGYGQPTRLPRRSERDVALAGGVRSITDAEGTGFTQRDYERHLRRAGERLEQRRAERRGGGVDERGKPSDAGTQPSVTGPVRERGRLPRGQGAVADNRGQNLGFDKPLPGQPAAVQVPGYGRVAFGPLPSARTAAERYMASRNRAYATQKVFAPLDEARAKRLADAFEAMEHRPNDPQVVAAYSAMIEETVAQYRAIEATGLKVEFIDLAKTGDPYAATPRLAQIDVAENNHLWVFKTDDGFGSDEAIDVSDNPMLQPTDIVIDGHTLRANDVFRIVHDYFGHVKDGHGFRARGEENAWQSHAAMYSPLARRAMTTETRGQNSWVNYGPYGEQNQSATAGETHYAPQKVGLLPQWASEEGALASEETTNEPQDYSFAARAAFRPPAGRVGPDDRATGPSGGSRDEGADRTGEQRDEEEITSPPVDEDGNVTIEHFTLEPGLTRTDPDRWGRSSKFLPQEERARIGVAPGRTYFGIGTGRKGGYVNEFPGGRHPRFGSPVAMVTAKVPLSRLYDMNGDPDGLKEVGRAMPKNEAGQYIYKGKPVDGVSLYELLIRDAGYAGYWIRRLGMVAAVFEPVDVQSPATKQQRTAYEQTALRRARQADTQAKAVAALKEMGIDPDLRDDLQLTVVAAISNIDYAGEYREADRRITIVGLDGFDAGATARHEVIHWMRDQRIITKAEWLVLAKWAKNNSSLMGWAKAYYPNESLDGQIEEAVAEGFSRWNVGTDPYLVTASDSIVAKVFARIRWMIQKLREAFGVAGITRGQLNDAARIMKSIRSGEQIARFDAAKAPVGFGRRPAFDAISRDMLAGRITPAQAQFLRLNSGNKAQAAWHGTPATEIQRFSLEFMGKGEGAQAFGWGLYFAQKRDIAEWYRKKLTIKNNAPATKQVRVGDQSIADFVTAKFGAAPAGGFGHGLAMVEVADRMHEFLSQNRPYNGWIDTLEVAFDKEMTEWVASARRDGDTKEEAELMKEWVKVRDVFRALANQRSITLDLGESAGATYKVEIPENEDLLDLDETLANQPPKVKAALEKIRDHMEKTEVLELYEENMGDEFWDWSGYDLQMKALKRLGYDDAFPFEGVSDELETALENGNVAMAASVWLRQLGIPGNRFLDRDSRAGVAESKTRNFVIFDDSAIQLVARELPRDMAKRRVIRAPQSGPLSDPTVPNPGLFRRIHDNTMAFLTKLGSNEGQGDWDAADSMIDAFRRKITQRYQQIIKTQRRAEKLLGVDRLAPDMNPMEMITADERGYKLRFLTDNMIRPMAQEMATRGVSMADLGLYLYARHAPARNARIAAINPEFRDPAKPGSGMTNADAAQIMADFVAEGKDGDLAVIAAHIDAMVAMAQQERLSGGLLTPAEMAAGFQPGDFYVPLRGNESIEPELEMDFALAARKGGGFSVTGKESHRMYGRESMADLEEIVGYTITQAQEAIDRAYRNRVATSMLNLFRSVPDPEFVKIDRVQRVAVWNKAKGQVEYQMQTRMTDPAEQQRTVFVKENGVTHRMTFNEKNPSAMRFVKAAKNLGTEQIGRVLQLMSVFTRLWSKSNTQWNIDFVLANAAKDVQTGVLNATTLNQKGLRRAMLKNIISMKPLMGAWMGSTRNAGAGFGSGNVWFETFSEFEANGGKLNYGQINPVEDSIRDAKREIRNAARSPFNPIKAGGQVLEFIDHLNGAFENMTRLAAYKALRDAGVPAKQAAEAVRELTTNFQQHGEWGPKFNAAYGFANASVIGGARFAKTVATNPTILGGLLVAGILSDMLNHFLDDEEWDNYTEEDKHSTFVLMMPDSFGFDIKVPAGYGLNAFITAGRKMSELWRGRKNKDGTQMSLLDAASDAGMGFVNAFAPITGNSFWNVATPTLFDPVVNIYRNQNNWGRPIMPTTFKEGEKPDSQLAFDNTHQFWKTVATGLNAIGGGNDVVPGWTPTDLSPETFKHVTQETVGGLGRSFMRTVGLIQKLATGEDVGPNDIPVVRRFAGLPFGAANAKSEETSAFYERINEGRTIITQATELMARHGKDSETYREYRAENQPIIEFAETVKEADKRLRAYNAADNAAERGAARIGGLVKKRDRNAITKVTGYTVPAGKQLTPEQVAKVKAKVKEKKEALAAEFNAKWKAEVMGSEQ